MARDHLAIPATSAVSESVFSIIGDDIITKKCNRLGADNTRRLLCLRDWGVLVEGKYSADGSDIGNDEAVDSWEWLYFILVRQKYSSNPEYYSNNL
jgi:hypothetical protein